MKRIEWPKGSGRFADYSLPELAYMHAFAEQAERGEITDAQLRSQISCIHDLKMEFAPLDLIKDNILAAAPRPLEVEKGRRLGRDERDRSMRQVDTNTNPEARKQILEAIREVALAQDSLIADDVWVRLGWVPAEPRVMGPLMTTAADRGWIERVPGEQRQAHRVVNHARPQQVWRSLVHHTGRLPV